MRPPTKKQYIREQKTICGKNYAEVDFCWISEKEHRAGTRGRKRFASSLAQQGRNAERARRTLVQLLNTNFDEQGFSLTLTYEDSCKRSCSRTARKSCCCWVFPMRL